MLRRILVLTAILILAAFLAILSLWFHPILVHLSQETGTSNASSRAYDFWSGFGSDIGELAILGGMIQFARRANCHNHGCFRLSLHTTADGYRLCRKCVSKPKSDLALHEIHADHS